jgi:hypothetical protein
MDTEAITLRPESPAAGATGVPIRPVFQWTAVIGAQAYELLVATDAGMNNPVIARTDEYALPGNVWQCDVSLEYGMTYYWKVRATNASTRSAWSTTGIFTTETAPASTDSVDETPSSAMNHEAMTLPESTNPITPVQLESSPTPMPIPDGVMMPSLSELLSVPNWIIYLIGILLSVIILALIVILAIVLKIKHIT